jgi:hypothetical protein
LDGFAGAALTGAVTFLGAGFSSSDEESELDSTFLGAAFLAATGAAFFFPASDEALLATLGLLTSYTFSTELDESESSLEDTTFFVGLVFVSFPIVVLVCLY